MAEIKKRVAKFEKGFSFTVPNVKVQWAKLQEVDRAFEPMWSIDMLLDDKTAMEFKEVGFNVQKNKDGDWKLKAKRKETTKAGKTQKPPRVTMEEDGTRVEEEVGNGSTCDVEVYARYISVMGKEYLTCYLNSVVVKDLVAFGRKTEEVPF